LVAIAGAIGGIALFFQGFRMLQYKRLILNTPLSKIRSASIGLVEVSGMPTGPHTMSAPITGQPCFYYRVLAWRWKDSGKGGEWEQALDESLSVPFFLEDATGRVLINPQGAELDVHRSFKDELQTYSFNKGSLFPENIRKFVAMRGLLSGDKIRLEERTIQPAFPLFVFGTLGENPGLISWTPVPHSSGTSISLTSGSNPSLTINFSQTVPASGMAMRMMQEVFTKLSGQESVRIDVRSTNGDSVALPHQVVNELRSIGVSLPPSAQSLSSPPDPNPDTAFAIASGLTLAAQAKAHAAPAAIPTPNPAKHDGPAAPASTDFDLQARVALGKGERGDPFTISWQSQREVVQALAWKSSLYIWGSPVFTLVCIYFLLVYWGRL
jgi:hypothetical protein